MFGRKKQAEAEQIQQVVKILHEIKECIDIDKTLHCLANERLDSLESNLAGLQRWVAQLDAKINTPKLGERAEG